MKRLPKISFDIFLTSFTAILVWFFVGVIIDKDLTSTFSLTYSMQCAMGVIVAVFGGGANICVYKDNNEKSADNGIFYGTLVSILFFGTVAILAKPYIQFMNMDYQIYLVFCRYSLIQIMLQSILQLVLMKLYYLEENSKANKIVIGFNILNLVSIIALALITKNQIIVTSITLILLAIYVFIILIKNIGKIDFKLNLKHSIKYNCVLFANYTMFFIIYFFGFSTSFSFGAEYVTAITFATFVTDVQWDMTSSIETVAKIDIVKKKIDFKEHFKNAYKLIGILMSMVLILSFIAYPIYKPDLKIVSIFVGLHLLDFVLVPFYMTKRCYLELEWSVFKTTSNVIIAYVIRTIISVMPTPFGTIIGQIVCAFYELPYFVIVFARMKKKGVILKDNSNQDLQLELKKEEN